jgi:hypothetical protein
MPSKNVGRKQKAKKSSKKKRISLKRTIETHGVTKEVSSETNPRKTGAKLMSVPGALATGAAQKLTFIGTVKSESATGVGLSVDRNTIDMEQDGDTWTGQRMLDVGESVEIKFRVKGLDTTTWSAEIDVDCKSGPVKIASNKGTIGQPGGSGFDMTAKIKPDVCG